MWLLWVDAVPVLSDSIRGWTAEHVLGFADFSHAGGGLYVRHGGSDTGRWAGSQY